MERVTGIGGVFFRVRDAEKLRAWYRDHLGIDVDPAWGGCAFNWREPGSTVWSTFAADSQYFPGPYMINYRVTDLDAMLAQLRRAGAKVDDRIDDGPDGRFGWATDPEGNRFELWQPPPGR
jgi:predicted enzyme related to lactoylglutathione lyase